MKKLVIALFAVCAILSSCQKTPEDKANDLIKENIAKMLTYPDSYESVETTVDSLFNPMYSVDFKRKAQRAMELSDRIEDNKTSIDHGLLTMNLHSGPYSNSVYDRTKYALLVVVPAIITLIVGLGALYNFDTDLIVGTITLVATFLGQLLKISSDNYKKEDETNESKR